MIPQELIKEAKELLGDRALDIITPKLEGYKELKALCPNHDDKNPSFSWDSKLNRFKCFTCNYTLDILDYYTEYESMSFTQAAQTLFNLIGIKHDIELTPEELASHKAQVELRDRLTREWDSYTQALKPESTAYKIINDEWGLTADTINRYRLGYAKDGYYSNRIVIPYLDRLDRVIYANGRAINKNNPIKYKKESNTLEGVKIYPVTPLYNAQALQSDDDYIVVVEGEKDCLTLLQTGYNALAFSGSNYKALEPIRNKKVYVIPDKEASEVGDKKANDIGELLGIYNDVFICELPLLEGTDKTDINDYYNSDRERFKDNIDKIINTSIPYKHKGKPFPFLDAKGRPQKRWENLNFLLWLNDIEVKYNKISNKIEITGLDASTGYDAMATDIESLCVDREFKLSKLQLIDYIHRVAMDNRYSPVQDYLLKAKENYKADKDYIRELFNTLTLVNPSDLNYKLFRKWLIKTVALAFNDDGTVSSDLVLVFQSGQGLGKGSWLKSISPNKNWIADGISLDTNNKDTIIRATGYWITELAELENVTTKKEQGSLKAFLTSSRDIYRIPYGRTTEEYPRMTSFYGSVNQSEFLKDDTGNRRYIVLEVEDIDYEHNVNLEGLWGQLTDLYHKGETHWLTQDEIELVNKINNEHRIKSETEQKLGDKFDWSKPLNLWSWLTATQIADELGIRSNSAFGREVKRAWENVLRDNGFTKEQLKEMRKQIKNKWHYQVPSNLQVFNRLRELNNR